MPDDITLYSFPMSRGRMAHWTLEELGIPYQLEVVRVPPNGDTRDAAFYALNPAGKIPVLVHNALVVTESSAICAYLADAFIEKGLAPKLGDPRRGTYLRWFHYAVSGYEAAMYDTFAPRTNAPPVFSIGHGEVQNYVDVLEQALLPGPFILGDQFTAADIYICSQVHFSLMMGFIKDRPALQAYADRCEARPAHVRMADRCNAILAEIGPAEVSYQQS